MFILLHSEYVCVIHYFSDYVLERQIALQSDDIIAPVASTDSPKKSYAEIMTGSSTIARYASAVGQADKPPEQQKTPKVGDLPLNQSEACFYLTVGLLKAKIMLGFPMRYPTG